MASLPRSFCTLLSHLEKADGQTSPQTSGFGVQPISTNGLQAGYPCLGHHGHWNPMLLGDGFYFGDLSRRNGGIADFLVHSNLLCPSKWDGSPTMSCFSIGGWKPPSCKETDGHQLFSSRKEKRDFGAPFLTLFTLSAYQLHGKRLIERRLFFQLLRVHFPCVFSGFFCFRPFFGPFQILRKTTSFLQCFMCKCEISFYHKLGRTWVKFWYTSIGVAPGAEFLYKPLFDQSIDFRVQLGTKGS